MIFKVNADLTARERVEKALMLNKLHLKVARRSLDGRSVS
jgi:hypothetical protein